MSESDTKHVCPGFNIIKMYWVIWNISSNHWYLKVGYRKEKKGCLSPRWCRGLGLPLSIHIQRHCNIILSCRLSQSKIVFRRLPVHEAVVGDGLLCSRGSSPESSFLICWKKCGFISFFDIDTVGPLHHGASPLVIIRIIQCRINV